MAANDSRGQPRYLGKGEMDIEDTMIGLAGQG